MAFLWSDAWIPGVIRLGHTRVSVFGFFAAAGLIGAIWLSQYTARFAGVDPQRLWDAGVFAVFAGFVASRALLIVQDPAAFVRYPLLVLSLPSLTYAAMALTAVAVAVYLRAVKLPLLAALDAWAPCAALLAAVLALAHFVEGTDAGMPAFVPWAVRTPGDTVLGGLHPVQIYAMLGTGLAMLHLQRRIVRPHRVGEIAGWGLALLGLLGYLLNMLTQPQSSHGNSLLEPPQWLGLAAMATGGWLLWLRSDTKAEAL